MADITNLEQFLTDVATSIKNKKGITETIPAANFDTEIESIATGTVLEKVVAEANEIVEDETVVKIDSTPIPEPVVIPENGITEVLTDKTLLAENIGLAPEKLVKGNTVLGVEGTGEGGVMTEEEYNLALATAYDILQRDIPMYTELEYIESTGTQYIDTLIKANNNLTINVDFMTLGSTRYHAVIGVRDTSSLYYLNSIDTDYKRFECGWNSPYVIKTSTSFVKHNVKTNLLLEKNSITISNDNGTYNNSISNAVFNSTGNMYLFNFNDNGNTGNIGNTRIYGCTISNLTDTLLILVPAIDKDGIICMYDKISNKFFYNKGTSDFIAGPIKNGGEN